MSNLAARRVMHLFPVALTFAGLSLAPTPPAVGQITSGTISGIVRDATGAVIPGASIMARNLNTGLERATITDDEGRYRLPQLALGGYEIRAALAGFKTAIRRGIELTLGREAVVNLTLEVGELQDQVTVTGEAPLVETSSSALASLVDERKMRDLPLNGRGFEQLVFLHPGAALVRQAQRGNTTGLGYKISVSGMRPESNVFLLDGLEINPPNNTSPGGAGGSALGVEALREFKVITSTFSAEFGRSSGGVVNAVTRSGTNELHGSAYWFHRNDNMDARNFFDPGPNPPEFKRNQFGFALGGPIAPNKSFFFTNYEALRDRLAFTSIATVPNLLARQGILPDPRRPGESIRIDVDPKVKPYLDLYPVPNGRDLGGGRAELVETQRVPTNENYFLIRMDHQLSSRDSFSGSFVFDNSDTLDPGDLAQFPNTFAGRGRYLTLEETRIFSPSLINKLRFGLNRSGQFELVPSTSADSLAFVPGQNFGFLDPRGGFARIGTTSGAPRGKFVNLFEYGDDVVYTRGKHSLKLGAILKRYQYNFRSQSAIRGRYRFRGFEDFLRGRPRDFTVRAPGSTGVKGARQILFGAYLQDDVQVRRALTLNLGMRYEFITVPTEAHGRISNLRNVLDPEVTVGEPLFENPSLKNFAPRLGFAWDPWRDGKTSLRGGFGIFYDQITGHHYDDAFTLPPFEIQALVSSPTFPDAFQRLQDTGFTAPSNLGTITFKPEQSYSLQYNFTLQRELLPATVLSVAYAGSRGIHITRLVDHNTALPVILTDGRKFFPEGLRRRNPHFEEIEMTLFDANSFYNSLQLSVQRRFSGNLQLQASYTFSRTVDDASQHAGTGAFSSSYADMRDPEDSKGDRGLSLFHLKHNFVLNYALELPFGPKRRWGNALSGLGGKMAEGWGLNGITTVTSGAPFNIALGFSRSRNQTEQVESDRPNQRAGFVGDPVLGKVERYLDPAAFELHEAGFFGNLGRNIFTGPKLVNFDLSLVKDTYVDETKHIQFRMEVFNLLNRANFSTPDRGTIIIFDSPSGVPVPNFSRIRQTVTTSRQIQLALKFIF